MADMKMYDLQKMTLKDTSECGLALRHLGDDANSMEDACNNIIKYLYQHFVDKESSDNSCVLIRLFKTHHYEKLTSDLQKSVCRILENDAVDDHLKCLILMATAGELPEWNSRHKSVGHKAIPIGSEEAIAQIPMISQLLQQLGLNPETVVQPDPNLFTDLEQRMYNVFYIPNALESPYIPAQKSFVIPFNVKSVLGFGGLLPSGNMFVTLMFLKVVVPRVNVDLFRPLALNIKMAILPFDDGITFRNETQTVKNDKCTINKNKDKTIQRLKSKVATLTQLLDVSDQSTITQSNRLEQAIANLQQTLDKLQETQIQLIHHDKMSSLGQMVAGVAHEINNPVNFIHGNLHYTAEYAQNLLNLVRLYQKHFPNSPAEIQQEIELIDLNFIISDFTRIVKSMRVGTQRIQEIVTGLRNFSRLDEAELKQVDIHEGIESTLMIMEYRLQSTTRYPKIEVIKEYSKLPQVKCHAGQLNQVFVNILANAIDALQESYQFSANNHDLSSYQNATLKTDNYPTIHISTQVLDEKWIAITITDNGLGITEVVKSKIFNPFYTTKAVGKGTGLGLSISYEIVVQKHHGELICNSLPGEGTEFLIKIPIKAGLIDP
jgi:two-component system, NtrC family, sensor kinase